MEKSRKVNVRPKVTHGFPPGTLVFCYGAGILTGGFGVTGPR